MSDELLSNPFPGLRPFEREHYQLFFGREGQSEAILYLLQQHRFLAVVGSSGSGKSSLIRAGLIPYLVGDFISDATSHWRVALMRPGHDPIANLAAALNKLGMLGGASADEAERRRNAMLLEASLRRGGLGLIEVVQHARLSRHEQVLVVVDQFEELFRFASATGGQHHEEDAAAFVKLLLEASVQTEVPIYVVLTMRSDFIGDCARYRDLPEAVTNGLYLIPRMTRDQRRKAIVDPVRVGGAEIAPRLVNRLLNDVGDNPDHLPILQNVLMRTWEHWQAHNVKRPLDLEDYLAPEVGGMAESLSLHANEAYDGLPNDHYRDVARRVLQALTERGVDNRETRRPTRFDMLAEVTGEPIEDVKMVVDQYRKPGRSFLMPPTDEPLEPGKIIDISHESLIRGWDKLREWVNEEADSAKEYRRLSDAAAREMARAGQGIINSGLWDDPDLKDALAWRDRQHPNAAWAKRYEPDDEPRFEVAMAFLEKSRKARDHRAAQAQAEIAQKERLRKRIQFTSLAASIILCVACGWALWQWQNARTAEQIAISERQHAMDAEQSALRTQSNFLADRANEFARKGDAATAVLLSLEALPDAKAAEEARRTRPFVSEALRALSSAKQRMQEIGLIKGHNDSVSSVEFSPDGQTLVTASWDTTVRLWNVASHSQIGDALTGHKDAVRTASFSPDGRTLVTASHDFSARLWDVATRRQIGEPLKHDDWVLTAVFGRDGKTVLTASRDKTARLWDVATGRQIGEPLRHDFPLSSAALSADGRTIVTTSNRSAFLWKITRGGEITGPENGSSKPIELKGHDGIVISASFSPDGKTVITASNDKVARLWDVVSGRPISVLKGHEEAILVVAFSPDGNTVLTGSTDETARLWDVKTGNEIGVLKHDDGVWAVAFNPNDGNSVVTGSFDNTVRLWNVAQRSESGVLKHEDAVWSAAFSRDSRTVVTGSFDKTARIWDVATRSQKRVTNKRDDWVRSVAFSPDGKTVVIASGTAWLWDVENDREIATLRGHDGVVLNVAFSTNGKMILTTSSDKTARLWDVANLEKPIHVLKGHKDWIFSAAFSPDDKTIITASRDKTARLWDVTTGKLKGVIEGHGKWVLSAMFNPVDDKTVVTSSWDKTARFWNIGNFEKPVQIGVLKSSAPIRTAAFSQDGRLVLTTSDNTAKIWDVAKLTEIATLRGHEGMVRSAAFSLDGKTVITASGDKTAQLWPVVSVMQDAQALVDTAKQNVPRCLTPEQRADAYLDAVPPAWCIEMEKWPYHTQVWKDWLNSKRAGGNPSLPDTP